MPNSRDSACEDRGSGAGLGDRRQTHQIDDPDENGAWSHVQTEAIGIAFDDPLVLHPIHGWTMDWSTAGRE